MVESTWLVEIVALKVVCGSLCRKKKLSDEEPSGRCKYELGWCVDANRFTRFNPRSLC